mgnify:CR=1 FL=1
MRIAFLAYRGWALSIVETLAKENEVSVFKSPEEASSQKISAFKPQLIFVAGWSWLIPREVLKIAPAIGLHPSMLPKYRGGSPIQHQIIRGEKTGGVTLFHVSEKLDKGEIAFQEEMSLDGHLDKVFDRISALGLKLFRKTISSYPGIPANQQDEKLATYFKRRKPEESEITARDFETKSAEELYNFVRALEDPYPNAFLKTRDNRKLFFKRADL